MKVLVGIKRVVDYAVKVRIDATKSGVELNNVKMSMNPFCEIAVEEAIRLKEKKIATEIVVVSIGSKQAQETIRTALAMGADRGIHVTTDMRTDQELQPLAVAKVLQAVAVQEKPDLILLGKQAIDGDAAQTGPLLAGLLGWPQATFASAVEMKNGKVQVCRETDSGMETLEMSLPSVITADLRLNEPRYATLPNIMKAKKKPIDAMDLEQFQVDCKPRLIYSQVSHPPERKAGVKVASVDDLLDKLKTEAGVL